MNDATAVTGTSPEDAMKRLSRHPSRAVRNDARVLAAEGERLKRLVTNHHCAGALDGVHAGDQCPVCKKESS